MINLPIQDRRTPIPSNLIVPIWSEDYRNYNGNLFLEPGCELRLDDTGQYFVEGLEYVGLEYLRVFEKRKLSYQEEKIAKEKGLLHVPKYSPEYFEICICMRTLIMNVQIRHIWTSFRLPNFHPLFGYVMG